MGVSLPTLNVANARAPAQGGKSAFEVTKVSLFTMFAPLHGDLEAFPQTVLAIWGSYLNLGAHKVTKLPRWGLAPSNLMFGGDAPIISKKMWLRKIEE